LPMEVFLQLTTGMKCCNLYLNYIPSYLDV
jgi:hypothetical protein